ncbi:hypothetical protein HS088_TW16G00404 [Tripterygium wilfordii]|uniref:DUF1308 domain-containing protein n=1 Tax=Tripterygium wilfordii TaxID=458696 RepID=A0A7J7CIR7_TRIWF|nr:UPF0415 protein C7orf25 homolog [Tripterygium wilfordii]XP_038678826.1 UPF0415 protein C7orf25 homolog [Tripterygium wilfordii]KAF5733963.1 hypothetical protein HS088_TW16G00404 [Tripterygium wilfordii]
MVGGEVEAAKWRCERVIERIQRLENINESCRRTLLKLAISDLHFLSTFSSSSATLSINIGHLEAVVYILQQPVVTGVSRVCKPIPLATKTSSSSSSSSSSKGVHVDVVCTLKGIPVWILVSDRNPKYVSWHGSHKDKGLKWRIEQLLNSAAQYSHTLKPSSVVLFFSRGLASSVHEKLRCEFGASDFGLDFCVFDFHFHEEVEGDWTEILGRSYGEACALELKLDSGREADLGSDSILVAEGLEFKEGVTERNLGRSFFSLLLEMKNSEFAKPVDLLCLDGLINFDTTALIAIVSGISNSCAEKLLATPENELRQRFKGNTEFVISQAKSEIQHPIHLDLGNVISGRMGMICESVLSEFKDLVSMCGGPNEKLRANYLLQQIMIVPDSPSERIIGLPTTRKLALKNKIVFGTADYWHAPTLTANMAFVRAISQTGMSLYTIEHRPRALTGD